MRVAMISRSQGLGHYSLMVTKAMPAEVFILFEHDAKSERVNNVQSIPCWHRESFVSDIVKELRRLKPDVVCVQHEFFLYGSFASAVLMPWLLWRIARLGLPVVLTVHGVIPTRLFGKDFLREAGLPAWPRLARAAYELVLNACLALSHSVLTTEPWLESELRRQAPLFKDKISVLLLGVLDEAPNIDQYRAKLELGLDGNRVALFLGYLAFYKGVERFVQAAEFHHQWGTDWRFVVVGGQPYRYSAGLPSPGSGQQRSLHQKVPPNLRMEGFCPAERIPMYLSAADVVVLPHKYLFSSSEPLALAVAFGKRILLSQPFANAVQNETLIFGTSPEVLARRIAQSPEDDALAAASASLTEEWRKRRNWSSVSRRYWQICCEVHGQRRREETANQ